MRRFLLAVSVAWLSACVAHSPASPGAVVSSGELTLQGEVVDSWCWAMDGKTGAGHRQCAVNCMENGNPPVFVAKDGAAWLLIPAYDHIPVLEAAKKRAGENIVLVGTPYRKGGMSVLAVREVRDVAAPSVPGKTGEAAPEVEGGDGEEAIACDYALARRAAALVFAEAKAENMLPEGFEGECSVESARCGTLPIEESLPPEACTITLHERFLRVERAAGEDSPRWLTAWVDDEVGSAPRPSLSRTSASRVNFMGKAVVIAGLTSQHRHAHAGVPAEIGHASFLVHNPLAKPLQIEVTEIEYLVDGECGLPNEVRARPRLGGLSTTTLSPGKNQIDVGFERQSAYQVHCDRFATRVTFRVEGQEVAATAEHEVIRFEPLRRTQP